MKYILHDGDDCRAVLVAGLYNVDIGVRAGGAGGGAAAPPKFWVTQIFWAAREIWAKPVFKEVSIFFFEGIHISILT